jgi:hypothetical protein
MKDGPQGLDGADENVALGYDSFGYVGTGHWQFTYTPSRFSYNSVALDHLQSHTHIHTE